eukprot:TRINITY_DN3200_c0_g1_i3.p1 TRINITY_DN3200_c0_g1~~TRINITY_DN3200_c0_g1_i3.p1  ORF type:complete len:124 (-),score=36.26 TRINITY_DN3200_c0_g1_i3:54-425(-)
MFGNARFRPVSHTEFLEFEGAEFILNGISSSVVHDLGERGAELEREEFNESKAKILKTLREHLVHNTEYLSQVMQQQEGDGVKNDNEDVDVAATQEEPLKKAIHSQDVISNQQAHNPTKSLSQ